MEARATQRFIRQGMGRWHSINAACRSQLPPQWRPWLLDKGSLTAKLQTKSQNQLCVQVVAQYSSRPQLSEARLLQLSPQHQCIVREVLLKGPEGVPWVFARSLFPLTSLTGRLRHLTRLANRPLGAYLFSQPQLLRSPIQVATLPANTYSGIPDSVGTSTLWGRRSVFYLYNKPLLVSEIFLPALLESHHENS